MAAMNTSVRWFGVAMLVANILPGAVFASPPEAATEPVRPVPSSAVHFTSGFWRERIDANRAITVPLLLARMEQSGRIDNFVRAAAVLRGDTEGDKKPPANVADDGEVF